MAARRCPQCQTKLPAGCVVAFSDGLRCPGCGAFLELSLTSRYLATTAGLAAGALAGWLAAPAAQREFPGWVLPLLLSFLVFSLVSPLVTLLVGDLVVKT
ncbi:MAG: hypothetical protein K6U02_12180, partial [Firmicutes bacterium]|nr:hypothetical protein [Bacillota bacterium]